MKLWKWIQHGLRWANPGKKTIWFSYWLKPSNCRGLPNHVWRKSGAPDQRVGHADTMSRGEVDPITKRITIPTSNGVALCSTVDFNVYQCLSHHNVSKSHMDMGLPSNHNCPANEYSNGKCSSDIWCFPLAEGSWTFTGECSHQMAQNSWCFPHFLGFPNS